MWVFLDGTKFTSTDPFNQMAFDGSNMWATTNNSKVKKYGFFGQTNEVEQEIDLSTYLPDAEHIIKIYNHMMVFDTNLTKMVKINSTTNMVVEVINIAIPANCYPAYGDFKIWFVTKEQNTEGLDNQQGLFYYDLNTNVWSTPVDIPGKHQEDKRKIVWGKSTFVYVQMANENGLGKYSSTDGSYVGTITTNRMSTIKSDLIVNDALEILVCGFNGMVTKVNQTTDVATNLSGLNASSSSIQDDGTYIWSIKPSLSRITKGSVTDNYLTMGGNKDFHIVSFSDATFYQIIIIPSFTHEEWDGTNIVTKIEPQRIALLASGAIYFAYNMTDSWNLEEVRPYEIKIRTTAMVGTGPRKYYGETV